MNVKEISAKSVEIILTKNAWCSKRKANIILVDILIKRSLLSSLKMSVFYI